MSRLVKSQVLGVWAARCYADIFDWPITDKEAIFWQVAKEKCPDIHPKKMSAPIDSDISQKIRQDRAKISQQKILLVQKSINLLKKIPTLQAIFLTGSVAMQNAKFDADIDLMLVTKPNTLWLTRIMVVIFLRYNHTYAAGLHKMDHICPNIFLDTNYLEIIDRNLFTAHEVLQAKCLWDQADVERKWLLKNKWTQEYLPNAYVFKNTQEIQNPIPTFQNKHPGFGFLASWNLENWFWLLGFLDFLAFIAQYLYMRPKISQEKIGLHQAFFHPNNLSKNVLSAFQKKISKSRYNDITND